MYTLRFTHKALKQIPFVKRAGLGDKVNELLAVIEQNPFQTPPFYEKLNGKLDGKYSRRINIQHRLVYDVNEDLRQIKIISMWSHYEDAEK